MAGHQLHTASAHASTPAGPPAPPVDRTGGSHPPARRSPNAPTRRPRPGRGPARSHPVAYPHRRSPQQLSRFAQILAEVLAGQRPVHQVRPLLGRRAYALLLRRAGCYAGAYSPRLRRTVLRTPAPDVAELTAVVDCGARCRALALRVAYAQHAWLCTHIETDVCSTAGS
ncbi:hypothetical protein GCM10023405_50570 [Streptomonospora salina]